MTNSFEHSNNMLESKLKDIYSIAINLSIDPDIINIMNKDASESTLIQYNEMKILESKIKFLYTYNNNINGITIGNFNGVHYQSGITLPFNDIISQPWVDSISNHDLDYTILAPHYSSKKEELNQSGQLSDKVISIVQPIKKGRTLIGFVKIDIIASILEDYFSDALTNENDFFITDLNTHKIILQNITQFDENDVVSINNKFYDPQSNHNNPLFNDNVFVDYTSKITGWTTIGVVPKSKVFYELNLLKKIVLMVTSTVFIVSMLIIYFTIHFLTKDLERFTKKIQTLHSDQLSFEFEATSSSEVNLLADAFKLLLNKINQLIKDIKYKERVKRHAEIRALEAQINPHFLHNTINTIKYLSSLIGATNIYNVSESLSKLMYINMSPRTFISIKEELDYLKSYLSIQAFKYSHQFDAVYIIDDDLDDFYLPKLLIQPIVENALVHGLRDDIMQNIITLSFHNEPNQIKIKVEDNGKGMSPEKISEILNNRLPSSIGLKNVISRIKLYMGEDYNVAITSIRNVKTTFEISLPKISKEEVIKYDEYSPSR